MRIYLRISKNRETIPFNYQELLTGTIHKWVGENNAIHGESGQISFSWIQNTRANKQGLNLKNDAYFFIGSYDRSIIKEITKGVLQDPKMFYGVRVIDVQIKEIPHFESSERFLMASPVLLKIKEEDKIRHITYEDGIFEEVLTENAKRKLSTKDLITEDFSIKLDPDSSFRQTKLVTYKGIHNKTTLAPIVIEGTPDQIGFIWSVGIGNSTGIGFGALK